RRSAAPRRSPRAARARPPAGRRSLGGQRLGSAGTAAGQDDLLTSSGIADELRSSSYLPHHPRNQGIRSQPDGKTSDETAAVASSYRPDLSGVIPVPHNANGTKPWLWVFVRRNVGWSGETRIR